MVKTTTLLFATLALMTFTVSTCNSDSIAVDLVSGMIGRVTPTIVDKFVLEISEQFDVDTYEIEQLDDGRIQITGRDGVSLASGYNYYLNNYLHASISWTGDNVESVASITEMPKVDGVIHQERFLQWSYYMNVCTESYSAVWWDWSKWERQIDWMAMRGINMPLMFTGQEFVWTQTFKQFGLTFDDLSTFFSGPAFMAWQRMGNLRGWGGPFDKTWMMGQYLLGKQIFDRMRALGMKPVLPAFAGHVPEKMATLYPDAKITQSPNWNGFAEQYTNVRFLEAIDPLYVKVGTAFVENLIKSFGPNDHLYNGDQFNEINPSTSDPDYLKQVGVASMKSIEQADPDAVWVMQGWLFYYASSFWKAPQIEAYMSGFDDDRLIMLDLYTDVHPVWSNTNSFYGKPFLWCELLDFGGNLGLYGRMDTVMNKPHECAAQSTMSGIGITMEGIFQNAIMFDMLLAQAWMDGPVAVSDWVNNYLVSRYGSSHPDSEAAWSVLMQTAYNAPQDRMLKPTMIHRPALTKGRSLYEHCDLLPAWQSLVDASTQFGDVDAFRNDVVDLTRQVLVNMFVDLHAQFIDAHSSGDIDSVTALGQQMLQLLTDDDAILATHRVYLLGRWLADADQWAKTDEEVELFRYNAKNQLTLWGPNGEINDYASKQWSGLVGEYYYGRWNLFITAVTDSMTSGRTFDSDAFNKSCLAFEEQWQKATTQYPTEPQGDTIEIASALLAKYMAPAKEVCGTLKEDNFEQEMFYRSQ